MAAAAAAAVAATRRTRARRTTADDGKARTGFGREAVAPKVLSSWSSASRRRSGSGTIAAAYERGRSDPGVGGGGPCRGG